jgi:hypothetical protein
MLQDSFEDLGLDRSRRTLALFAVEFQPALGAEEEVTHAPRRFTWRCSGK